MRTVLLLLCLIPTGCSSVGSVIPVGGDTYMVSSSGHYQSWTHLKTLCVESANKFCADHHQKVSVVNSDTHGVRGWSPQEVEVNFKCY
jgi:hypothetical protein